MTMKAGQSGVGSAGLVGTVLALCGCLGFPVVIGLLSLLGVRWILQPRYLLPILAIGVGLGLWSLIGFFRRSGESLPLVLGLIGGSAALTTEIIRAATHQHAYFLGYPGLALFVGAFVLSALIQVRRPQRQAS
ncbi:MAG: MerC domain-containing protein [Candidatus Rokubacteria bacterium]|nr:MerC domain-containing protein [Candidatus Rokubacteria bacterium]